MEMHDPIMVDMLDKAPINESTARTNKIFPIVGHVLSVLIVASVVIGTIMALLGMDG